MVTTGECQLHVSMRSRREKGERVGKLAEATQHGQP